MCCVSSCLLFTLQSLVLRFQPDPPIIPLMSLLNLHLEHFDFLFGFPIVCLITGHKKWLRQGEVRRLRTVPDQVFWNA